MIGRREHHRRVEVPLRRRSVADPAGGDPRVARQRGRHRPSDGLDELGGEVAGHGEEPQLARRVHHGELAALQRVGAVRVDLVDHVDQRVAGRDQQPLLAVGREAHVAGTQGAPVGARHRLLTERLHVERGLPLSMCLQHAGVEDPYGQHVAQPLAELLGVERSRPRPDGITVDVEHTDHLRAEIDDVNRRHVDRRAAYLTGPVDQQVTKGRLVAGSRNRFRDSQPQRVSHTGFRLHDTTSLSTNHRASPVHSGSRNSRGGCTPPARTARAKPRVSISARAGCEVRYAPSRRRS